MTKNIFFIGPGSVGKTTVGELVAGELGYAFVDVDAAFYERIAPIGDVLDTEGHDAYCEKNSALVDVLLKEYPEKTVFATPAGYLTHKKFPHLVQKHAAIIKGGISVLLLPSEDLHLGVDIIAARQLSRWPNLDAEEEKKRFLKNAKKYQHCGDVHVFSMESPEVITAMILEKVTSIATVQNIML